MLNLQAVNHFYGNQHSLWNVDLVLRPGECIGVLGREGMGKTTLVNCIAGYLPVASGRMTWHDIGAPPQDLTPCPLNRAAPLVSATCHKINAFFPNSAWKRTCTSPWRPGNPGLTPAAARFMSIFPSSMPYDSAKAPR